MSNDKMREMLLEELTAAKARIAELEAFIKNEPHSVTCLVHQCAICHKPHKTGFIENDHEFTFNKCTCGKNRALNE